MADCVPGSPAAFLSPLVWSRLWGGLLRARLHWGAVGGLPEAFLPFAGPWPILPALLLGAREALAPSMARVPDDWQAVSSPSRHRRLVLPVVARSCQMRGRL